jgi:hypothetical protein
MELLVTRKIEDNVSTIGNMSINGTFECHTLEDKYRGLVKTMTAAEIAKIKVPGKTAIPSGRYEVVITYSTRFKRLMPKILNVPGFAGVRIHWGNYIKDTDGCILVGKTDAADFIGRSVDEFNAFFDKLKSALKTGKVFITIK